MQNRNIAWFATPALILLIASLIWAVVTPRADSESITATGLVVEVGEPTAVPVGSAGTVVLLRSATRLEVLSAVPNLGYTPNIVTSSGRIVKVEFTSNTERILFTAALVDDEVTVSTTVEANPDSGVLAASASSFARSMTSASNSTITTTSASSAASRTTAGPSTTTTRRPPVSTTAPTPTTATNPPTTTTTTAAPTTTSIAPTTTVAPTTTTIPPTTSTTVAPTTTTIPPTTTTTVAPTTTTTAVPVIPDGVVTYSLGPAGTITVTFLNQKFVGGVVNAAPGWSVDKADGGSNDIRVELVKGNLRTIWEARIQNGRVIIDLRTVEND